MKPENDVILSVLKLSRAIRRCPPRQMETPFPPAVGRLLECVAANPRVSSRDLCEMLDLRPSSLSEMLARAESEGWIVRTVDEDDRRVQHLSLSDKGSDMVSRMEAVRKEDFARKTACFTEEEKAQFCALSNKLSEHMESLASDVPEEFRCPPPPRPHGEQPRDDRPNGDRPFDGRPDAGPFGDQPRNARPDDGRPFDGRPDGRPFGDQPRNARPDDGRPFDGRPDDRPFGDRPHDERPREDRPRDGRPPRPFPPEGRMRC